MAGKGFELKILTASMLFCWPCLDMNMIILNKLSCYVPLFQLLFLLISCHIFS